MPRLPTEILDQIWLERCKIGFEPRILQAKWVNVDQMRIPAFYTTQPQVFTTQLCHGARQVTAKGFYSRVFDNPCTGDGGFWWSDEDVLYIDKDFYRELHPPRKAVVLGRDRITHIALDVQIDEDTTTIVELILHWFPKLSQVFFTGSAQLFSELEYWEFVQCPRPEVCESAIAKSFPITTFHHAACPRGEIPGDLFIRVQGLTNLLNDIFPDEEMRDHYIDVMYRWGYLGFFIFDCDETYPALVPDRTQSKHESEYLRTLYLFMPQMLTTS